MTFIIGINLTDRIYLAADTKVTKQSANGDKQLSGYCIKLASFTNADKSGFISCAFAGVKDFARFLINEMSDAFESEALSTDINTLKNQIEPFLSKVIPKYAHPDKRQCKMIFGGISKDSSIKMFDGDRFSEIIGPEGFKVEDENFMTYMKTGAVLGVPDQKIFSVVIDEPRNLFGIETKRGNIYSLIYGGSTELTEEKEREILRYFVAKRENEYEVKGVINLLRSKFSDTIGGAIVMGFIDYRGHLINVGYDIEKIGPNKDGQWSIRYDDNIIAIDADGNEHDLIKGLYEDPEGSTVLDLDL